VIVSSGESTFRYSPSSWEYPLLSKAYRALESHTPLTKLDIETHKLEQAYRHCDAITQEHSRTFYIASALLPPSERRAIRALYAFCRTTDDIVDRTPAKAHIKLQTWRQRSLAPHPDLDDCVALTWADTRARYHIPTQYAEHLIEGVARDLTTSRYATFSELAAYCYDVASTVGLMIMHIVGFASTEAIPYAIKLGVALQLTNILRDVGEDWQLGRLYLPQEELAAFGLTEDDVAAGRVDHRWQAFMRFQIERARRLYKEALPGIALLNRKGRFAIAAAAELYHAILNDIEAQSGDVFRRRAYISDWQKLSRLPGIWWRSVITSYH
jgi:phytoene synthase